MPLFSDRRPTICVHDQVIEMKGKRQTLINFTCVVSFFSMVDLLTVIPIWVTFRKACPPVDEIKTVEEGGIEKAIRHNTFSPNLASSFICDVRPLHDASAAGFAHKEKAGGTSEK